MILRADVCSSSGYAELSRLLLEGLVECGEDVALDHIGEINISPVVTERQAVLIEECKGKPRTGPVLQVCTPPQYDFSLGRSVGVALFEAFAVPDAWLLAMSHMHRLVTFSEFNRHLFSRQGLSEKKVFVVPPIVDTTRFHPDVPPLYCPNLRDFVILFVGQLILRKGWDILLEAACREFRREEGVCILLKVPPQKSLNEVRALLTTFGRRRPPVLVAHRTLPGELVPRLYQCTGKMLEQRTYPHIRGTISGCMALPSLGEGIALPYLEAMASGVLVVGTTATGQSVFLDSTCAVVVPTAGLARHRAQEIEHALYRGAPFLNVSIGAVRAALRRAYELSSDERQRLIATARERAAVYTPRACAEEVLNLVYTT